MDSICVAVNGTVSISSEEYRELVTAQAYLNVIVEAATSEKSYIVDNMVEVITRLVKQVRTAETGVLSGEEGEADA